MNKFRKYQRNIKLSEMRPAEQSDDCDLQGISLGECDEDEWNSTRGGIILLLNQL